MGIMGCIGLSGVVVNDSLVMVDYINKLKVKFKSKNISQVVIQGAVTRLRPIFLTTLTTFEGVLLPTAYGMGGRDALIYPAAISLSWGLFFATFLTLFILPVFYLIEDDVKRLFKKIKIFNN